MSTGKVFSCPVDGWLDNDNPKEPSSRTVSCRRAGCIIEQATDYDGQDLEGGSKIKVTANQQECADYSASTPGSLFWTWSKTTKKCYPKSSNAGRKGAGIELVSGNNICGYSGIWQQYNGGANCWSPCGSKGGLCEDVCGPKGYCCRKGYGNCPVLAANVSPVRHSCVSQGFELEPVGATLSSTHTRTGTGTHGTNAGNCIDGVINSANGESICHTNNDATPWIAIDYGTSVSVQRVELFNRHDNYGSRTKNVDVRISNELPTSETQMFSGGTLLGHFAGPGTDGQHIVISGQTQL
jgi:hypothetical protein